MKANLLGFLLGGLIALPISLYAVNHQTPATVPVHYDSEMIVEACEVTHEESDLQPYGVTQEELEEELYYDSLELLALCVEVEAGNQGLIGKKYVVDVILNRVDDEDFPDNITDVIMQKNQFSVVLDGRIWEVEPTEETFQAVREELENRTNSEVLYFTSEGYHACGKVWRQIGDHYFSVKKDDN